MVKNLPAMQETQFDPWVRKIPRRRKWQPTPVFLLENSMHRGVKAMVFPVVMYGCESWTVKKAEC